MKSVYCIFYIERKYYKRINQELKDKGYKKCHAIIPELKVLRKAIKGKVFYEEVPVLFNYGFMRMPLEYAYSRPFLIKLRKEISGIRNWLRNTHTMFPRKIKRRIDNPDDFDDFSIVAICPRQDVRRFVRIAKKNRLYTAQQVNQIKEGDYVVLNIYPYEGLEATIKKVNKRAKTVTLNLFPQMGKMEVTIPIDHVIYSIYHNDDPEALYINPLEVDPNRVSNELVEESFNQHTI